PVPLARHDFLATEPVLHRHDRRPAKVAVQPLRNRFHPGGLGGDDDEIHRLEQRGIRCGEHARMKIGFPGDPQAVPVQGLGMILAPHERLRLHDRGEMAGEETADRPRTGHAYRAYGAAHGAGAPAASSPRGRMIVSLSSGYRSATQAMDVSTSTG